MGYACPVCGDPQADAEHLANHLAFSAMLGDDAHEDWLADHAPDWDESDADRLAPVVTAHAEEIEYPQVFEDTTDDGHDHDHEHDHAHGRGSTQDPGGPDHRGQGRPGDDPLPSGTSVPEPSPDDETAEILREARELTRKRRESGDSGGEESTGEGREGEAEESETE